MRAIILDLDNCVADDGWRIKYIDWNHQDLFRRYHMYHSLSPWDALGNRDLFNRSEEIFILTARPVLYREMTEEWLNRNGARFKALLMRNNDDSSPSVAMKLKQIEWLQEYGVGKNDIVMAYDDRIEVVEAYREAGIQAEVRKLHEIDAYFNPRTGVNHANGKATRA